MKSATRSAFELARLTVLSALLGWSGAALSETVLITGANSGIGLEFSKQYAEKGWHVIATHRRDETPATLGELSERFGNVRVERMDVGSQDEVRALAAKLADEPIDVLINNAGVFSLGDWLDRENTSQHFGSLAHDQFDIFMRTNVRGPVMVTEAFIDSVRASDRKVVVSISSTIGTISTPEIATNALWYGTSKAALNKAMVTLAEILEESGVTVAIMHPGSVLVEKQDSLDLPGMIETPVSVRAMIETIDGLEPSDSGRFLNYDGASLPW